MHTPKEFIAMSHRLEVDYDSHFLDHTKLISKFNLKTTFIKCLQLKSCIPADWKNQISKAKIHTSKLTDGNFITLKKRYISIEKTTCKDLYWHLIQNYQSDPKCLKALTKEFPGLKSVENKTWKRIFNTPFIVLRDTKLQSFQYRIIHKIIPCNKWLHTIKIKKDNICNFCSEVDDIIHFFINMHRHTSM